eukprot:s3161_g12.t1
MVVIVLDLHAIGGNCFACVLPVTMEEEALRAFAATLASRQASELDVYVSDADRPSERGAPLHLDAGMVVRAGICLLYNGRRFFVNKRQYPTQPPLEVAANTVGLAMTDPLLKMATSGLDNVLLHGNICKGVACIVAVARAPEEEGTEHARQDNVCFFDLRPLLHGNICKGVACIVAVARAPEEEGTEHARQDNVCFFDLRPLGVKPTCHYQVGSVRHLPTVLALLDVRPPPGFVLEWDCAWAEGFIDTPSGATVTFRAVPERPALDVRPPPGFVLEWDCAWAEGFIDTPSGATVTFRAVPERPAGPTHDTSLDGDHEDSEDAADPDGWSDDADDGDDADRPPAPGGAPASPHRPRSRSPRRFGAAGCTLRTVLTSWKPPFKACPSLGFAGMWVCWNFFEVVHAVDTHNLTSADDGPLDWVSDMRTGAACLPDPCLQWSHFPPWLFYMYGPRGLGVREAAPNPAGRGAFALFAVLAWRQLCKATCRPCKGNDVPDTGRPYSRTPASDANRPGWDFENETRPVQRPPPRVLAAPPDFVQQPAARVIRTWHFVVLGPDLSKEHIEIQLHLPCDTAHALERVPCGGEASFLQPLGARCAAALR